MIAHARWPSGSQSRASGGSRKTWSESDRMKLYPIPVIFSYINKPRDSTRRLDKTRPTVMRQPRGRVTLRILGGQQATPQRCEHVGDRDGALVAVPGRAGAVGGQVAGGLAVVGVPDDCQAVADQAEGDQALHRAAGAGAGLADAGQVAGVQGRGLLRPSGRRSVG